MQGIKWSEKIWTILGHLFITPILTQSCKSNNEYSFLLPYLQLKFFASFHQHTTLYYPSTQKITLHNFVFTEKHTSRKRSFSNSLNPSFTPHSKSKLKPLIPNNFKVFHIIHILIYININIPLYNTWQKNSDSIKKKDEYHRNEQCGNGKNVGH